LIPKRYTWPNLTRAESSALESLKGLDIGFNMADKNYGPVAYSKELSREQCQLHLEDGKGTYRRIVDETKEEILREILLKLRVLLIPFKELGEAWALVCGIWQRKHYFGRKQSSQGRETVCLLYYLEAT
jgi:hypothetical protein